MPVQEHKERPKIRQVIDKIGELPTPPFVYQQIIKVLNNRYSSAFDAAAIISEDAAITARILKFANSAYYGHAKEVTNVKQAVVIMGIQALKSLVLSSSILDYFKSSKSIDQLYNHAFWKHSLAVAVMAKIIARHIRKSDLEFPEEAFSAGILHDIGKIVISTFLAEYHENKVKYVRENRCSEYDAESETAGFTHTEIGRYFAECWSLPRELADTVYFHHSPASTPGNNDLPYIVHLANYLAHSSTDRNFVGISGKTTEPYDEIWDYLSIDPDMQKKFTEELSVEYNRAQTFLHIG